MASPRCLNFISLASPPRLLPPCAQGRFLAWSSDHAPHHPGPRCRVCDARPRMCMKYKQIACMRRAPTDPGCRVSVDNVLSGITVVCQSIHPRVRLSQSHCTSAWRRSLGHLAMRVLLPLESCQFQRWETTRAECVYVAIFSQSYKPHRMRMSINCVENLTDSGRTRQP